MKINTESEYKAIMAEIETYLQKATSGGGFAALTAKEGNELHRLSLLAEAWEDSIPLMPIRIKPPQTLPQLLELKMFEQHLKQRDLAQLLAVSEARLSEVLTGKRKPNLDLAKRMHERLGIDAGLILRMA
jgi:HTH-type transcriptional regulator / antitoxin HigA